MTAVQDHTEEDLPTEGDTVELSDLLDDDRTTANKGQARQWWADLSKRKRAGVVAGGVVGLWLFASTLGALRGGSGGSTDSEDTTTTVTADPIDAMVGLPELNPFVAAFLRTADLPQFANHIRTLTADGTSPCGVYFGVTLKREPGAVDRWVWSLNTQAAELRKAAQSVAAVHLPSSGWPVPVFYGPPCDVEAQDQPVVLAPTTTVAPTTTTTKPVSPVSVPQG